MRAVTDRTCPICGSFPIERFKAKYLQALKCGNSACGHIYASENLIAHGIQNHPEPLVELEQYKDRNRRLVRFWKNQGFLQPNSVVLDFGAGAGHISLAIRESVGTNEIICIEADASAQSYIRANGLNTAGGLDECRNDFDAVLLIEVIEHIDSPVELLKALKSHLRLGGKMFLSTPCGELRSGSRKTNAYDTPEHIHFFTEGSLGMALRLAGFTHIEFLTVPAMYPHERNLQGQLIARLKGIARYLRDRILGYSHLVVFAS